MQQEFLLSPQEADQDQAEGDPNQHVASLCTTTSKAVPSAVSLQAGGSASKGRTVISAMARTTIDRTDTRKKVKGWKTESVSNALGSRICLELDWVDWPNVELVEMSDTLKDTLHHMQCPPYWNQIIRVVYLFQTSSSLGWMFSRASANLQWSAYLWSWLMRWHCLLTCKQGLSIFRTLQIINLPRAFWMREEVVSPNISIWLIRGEKHANLIDFQSFFWAVLSRERPRLVWFVRIKKVNFPVSRHRHGRNSKFIILSSACKPISELESWAWRLHF